MLNREQQAVTKDIAMKKCMDMYKALYLFLIGGAGTGKTFTAKAIFQMLMKLYDSHHSTNPLKPEVEIYVGNYDLEDGLVNGADGIIKAYTKKMKFMSYGSTSLMQT
ncbi:unnamed protein product [Adineta steineri]|uniref:Uncharacterized protein n=1 Tax=Adineta steineri TaxID=433720 RepID=A0A819USG3_9BILA|nr:unnamed protein product [Adineta steineri]